MKVQAIFHILKSNTVVSFILMEKKKQYIQLCYAFYSKIWKDLESLTIHHEALVDLFNNCVN